MKEITVKADIANIPEITDFICGILEEYGCSPKITAQLSIAADELASNVAKCAYPDGEGYLTISVDLESRPDSVILTFTDEGIPFDPTAVAEPDVSASAEERTPGGLGLLLVRKMTDGLFYENKDGKNVLRVVKRVV